MTAYRTAQLFSLPRRGYPRGLTQLAHKPGALVGLRLLGPTERWLVAAYTDGAIGVWDLGAGARSRWSNKSAASEESAKEKQAGYQIACHVQPSSRWTSFEAVFELASAPESRPGSEVVDEGCVYIVVNESLGTRSMIYRVKLPSPNASLNVRSLAEFELIYTIVNPQLGSTNFIRAFDYARRLVVLSYADRVVIIRWPDRTLDGSDSSEARMTLSMQSDDLEELWNGVILVRIAGPYVVIFKTRSIEAYPLVFPFSPGSSSPYHRLPSLIHRFRGTTFKEISCSDVFSSTLSPGGPQDQSLKLTFFGSDILQGVFRYTLCIRIPLVPEALISGNIFDSSSTPTGTPLCAAYLDVECVGIYAMTNNIDMGAIFPPRTPSLNTQVKTDVEWWSESPSPSPSFTQTPTPFFIPLVRNSDANSSANGAAPMTNLNLETIRIVSAQVATSRGFVSAFSLGPQGKRAVWVERRRGSLMREIVVWTKEEGAREDFVGGGRNVGLEGRVVFSQGSYDLRVDLIHCALGEVSGRIVVGNRVGALSVLGLE